jgi:hypothetical protein
MLQADYKRVLNGEPLPQMDTARLQLPEPPVNKRNDVAAWRAALDNAHSQLEHQYNRYVHIQLRAYVGPSSLCLSSGPRPDALNEIWSCVFAVLYVIYVLSMEIAGNVV